MASNNNKIGLPSSQGGLVGYSTETNSKYQFQPIYVLVIAGVILALEILLHLANGGF